VVQVFARCPINEENLDKKDTYMVFEVRNTYIFINAYCIVTGHPLFGIVLCDAV
jgi:hypothetical protein